MAGTFLTMGELRRSRKLNPYNPAMATALGIILTSISMLALGWLVWTQVQKQESRDNDAQPPKQNGK